METKKRDVEIFLKHLIVKLNTFDIVFLNRDKNIQTLLELEISPSERVEIIKNLCYSDYSDGPKEDKAYNGTDMWIFGKKVKEQEVYIKITLGEPGRNVLCISFHLAEHLMNHPLKEK